MATVARTDTSTDTQAETTALMQQLQATKQALQGTGSMHLETLKYVQLQHRFAETHSILLSFHTRSRRHQCARNVCLVWCEMAGKLQKQQAIAQAISPQALLQRVALAADEAEQTSDRIAEAFVDGDTEVMGWEARRWQCSLSDL